MIRAEYLNILSPPNTPILISILFWTETQDKSSSYVSTFYAMKLVKTLVTSAAFRSLSFGRESAKEDFKKLELEKPLNWIAGSRLFPANVIAGFNSELSQYDAQGWADYILGQCKQFSACTSTTSFQGAYLTFLSVILFR